VPGRRVLLAAAGLLAALSMAAVLAVSFVRMRRASAEELCRGRLLALHLALRSGDLPDSPRWEDAGTGRLFLASQERWPAPTLRELDLTCPVLDDPSDEIQYRGPARPLGRLTNADPVAADRPGNHGRGRGGNVLLRTGAIYAAEESHALWIRAAQTTSD
jgi:hypothetical protein